MQTSGTFWWMAKTRGTRTLLDELTAGTDSSWPTLAGQHGCFPSAAASGSFGTAPLSNSGVQVKIGVMMPGTELRIAEPWFVQWPIFLRVGKWSYPSYPLLPRRKAVTSHHFRVPCASELLKIGRSSTSIHAYHHAYHHKQQQQQQQQQQL
ncbi:hypothetical protein PTSG_12487 [Salpingoeca rosetta]|uniref:Uncharacterized protein n=1 Tax=Salpingoeca rosetta (strain ATCC 50818 / BSB-021) TaxID=946362 RepID=F2UEU7_SALR5|nr:uncharacterized protein PTSG_12487 [Salpingoeca rosetta]EGD75147.1 hypothetical protein PTSG_12487 [Salpingoeca rosetta]|eukprot:XP_004992200.1 hypothetical protein PTSG_12487 [Salpingoeca rosetta]